MNTPTSGYGTLRMNGGAVARGTVSAEANVVQEREKYGVRLKVRESFLGGCQLEMMLSPEDAASFANLLYALAGEAMNLNDARAVPAKPAIA